MNKSELLDKMAAGRAQLESVLSQLADVQMLLPGLESGWSVKDLIGHFGWWENRAIYLFRTLKSGGTIELIDGNIDDVNAQVYAENKAQSLADIRRMEADAYAALKTMVESATEDDLFNPKAFAWTNGKPFADWIEGNAHGHYDEHKEPLVAWAKSIGAVK